MIVFNNSEIRYLLLVYPIIILMLGKTLTSKQFRSQAIIFFILSLVVINPYLIQIKYETNLWDLSQAITKFPNYTYNPVFKEDIIKEDINLIVKEYPYQTFVVGNRFDDYNIPAELYWGEKVKEFISIQDYQLFMKNESSIFKQTICSKSKGWWRRDLCFTIDLRKTINDQTDYSSIRYAISLDKTLDLENFELIKEYEILTLYKKLL